MGLFDDSHQKELRTAGWHSLGYLPHFDGIELPQFITIHLADSIPKKVIKRWKQELNSLKYEQERILLQRRIERYLDQGYGEAVLKDRTVAAMVQNALLKFDGTRYRLFAWVVTAKDTINVPLSNTSVPLPSTAFRIRGESRYYLKFRRRPLILSVGCGRV